MFTPDRKSVIHKVKERREHGPETHQGSGGRNRIQLVVLEIRPKATARFNEKGEQILQPIKGVITPKSRPPNASVHPLSVLTVPATSEPQREGEHGEGKTPMDQLVVVATQSSGEHAAAKQGDMSFKQSVPVVETDTAADAGYLPHTPLVEGGDSEDEISVLMAPASVQVESANADITFKQIGPDSKSDVCRGTFKHASTELAATRDSWLQMAVNQLDRRVFSPANHALPTVKATVGFPSKKPLSKVNRVIGQCWSRDSSDDGVNQIFINPTLTSPVQFVDVLAHELVHAVDDCKSGHKHAFQKICKAVGLTEGRPASASAGPELMRTIEDICADLGTFPHAALSPGDNEKVQTTRLRKIECPVCGWTGRTTAKWAAIGLPTCHCGSKLVPTLRRAPAVDEQFVEQVGGPARPSDQGAV